MKHKLFTILPLVAALTGAALPLSVQAGFKCWTNKDGVRECGEEVPPEYAQKKTETFSDQGLKTGTTDRAKTREEIAAEREAKRAAEQAAAEERQRRAIQAAHDRVLLATFTDVKDIDAALDQKLALIDGYIEVTTKGMDKIKAQLDDLNKRAERLQKQNKPIPDELQSDIDALSAQLADKEAFIAAKEGEKKELSDVYHADKARFIELKSGSTAE